MRTGETLSLGQVIALFVVFLIALPVCLTIYSHHDSRWTPVAPSSSNYPLSNGYVLNDWLPDEVSQPVVSQIDNYLSSNNVDSSTLSIQNGKITTSGGNYNFTLTLSPQGQTHSISVRVNNYSGILSTAVYIDGQLQVSKPLNQSAGTQFNGFDALTNAGLSAVQTSELQQELLGFGKGAQSISIDNVAHIIHRQPDGNITQEMDFGVQIDGKNYQAVMTYNSITDIHLYLRDSTGTQVFDSGVIDTSVQP